MCVCIHMHMFVCVCGGGGGGGGSGGLLATYIPRVAYTSVIITIIVYMVY